MLDDVLRLFEITPDVDLDVMTKTQSLTDITTRVLTRMEPVLVEEHPDVVLVHGDTTTSTAAALAAFYQKIPVGHVEAGLRTSSIAEPYPEEANRRITGVLTAIHFAPTARARANLLAERTGHARIFVTGNTVIDAFLATERRVRERGLVTPALAGLDPLRPIIFVTAHRRENHEQMGEIARARRDDRRICATPPNRVAGPPLAPGRTGRARGGGRYPRDPVGRPRSTTPRPLPSWRLRVSS